MALTVRQIEKLVRDGRAGMTSDGDGLALRVTAPGRAAWVLRFTAPNGARRLMALGAWPVLSLPEARARAAAARKPLLDAVCPLEKRRADEVERRARVTTFDRAAERFLAGKLAEFRNEKHRDQWRTTLSAHASPAFGGKPVGAVTTDDVLRALRPIWGSRTETASRVRGRIESVLSYAMQAGLRPHGLNPAQWRGVLDHQLPAPTKVAKVEHHAALAYAQVPAFMLALGAVKGTGARALELAILTAARSGEVRGATWREFDLDAALWTVPGDRMKASREHRVPLAAQAVELLRALPRSKTTDLVFPSRVDTPLSDMVITMLIRRMHEAETKAERKGWTDPKENDRTITAHGFRSAFRDWCATNGKPRDLAERALAHTVSDAVEAAYYRDTLVEQRRPLMAEWATFCLSITTTPEGSSK
jgi:integrase